MEGEREAVTRPARLSIFVFFAAALAAAPQTPVILISIDTLRADRVGVYGGRSVPTPGIDSFAPGGTLFGAAEAQVPLTLPSHTSLLTSTYPFQTGVEENAEHVPANLVTLAGVLHEHGYQTAAFIGSVFLERQLGLDRGFDFYDSPFQFDAFSPLSGEIFFVGAQATAWGSATGEMVTWWSARPRDGSTPGAASRSSPSSTFSICTRPMSCRRVSAVRRVFPIMGPSLCMPIGWWPRFARR